MHTTVGCILTNVVSRTDQIDVLADTIITAADWLARPMGHEELSTGRTIERLNPHQFDFFANGEFASRGHEAIQRKLAFEAAVDVAGDFPVLLLRVRVKGRQYAAQA